MGKSDSYLDPPDPPEDPSIAILEEIDQELARQQQLAKDSGEGSAFDQKNLRNDWVAYVVAYLGRASHKVFRNQREKCDYRENLIKAGALIVAAIRAHDLNWTDIAEEVSKRSLDAPGAMIEDTPDFIV